MNTKKTDRFNILRRTSALLAILLTILLFSGCGEQPVTINLLDYVGVEFSGDNGRGYVSANFDYNTLENELIDILGHDGKDTLDLLADLMIIEDSIDCSFDKKSTLSNGDVVTLTVSFDSNIAERYHLSFTGGTSTYQVNGLAVIPEFSVSEKDIVSLLLGSEVFYYTSHIPVTEENILNMELVKVEPNYQVKTAEVQYSFELDCAIAVLTVSGAANYRYNSEEWVCTGHWNLAEVKEWTLTGTYVGTEWGIAGSGIGCKASYEIIEIEDSVYEANVTWSASDESGDMEEITVTIPLVGLLDNARFAILDNSSVTDALGYSPYLYRAIKFDFANGGFDTYGELSLKKIVE